MARSLKASANFMGKLQVALLSHAMIPVRIFPFMDGAYLTCPDESAEPLLDTLRGVFHHVAYTFHKEEKEVHRFMIRAAIAFGPIVHGDDIPVSAYRGSSGLASVRNHLLLGSPVGRAYAVEGEAPPFGVFLDESVRSFTQGTNTPLSVIWWNWFNNHGPDWLPDFKNTLVSHYAWLEANLTAQAYPPESFARHRKMASEYFGIQSTISSSTT